MTRPIANRSETLEDLHRDLRSKFQAFIEEKSKTAKITPNK